MAIDQTKFISRFLYQINDEEPYWVAGSPPKEETIKQALAIAKDDLNFESHRSHFEVLADVLDACVAEELASHGNGIAAKNASKHPRVLALVDLSETERAGIALVSVQTLAWMEQCRKWVQDHSLRNQIAKRVLTGILVTAGRIKSGYSDLQLAALAQIGVTLHDMDLCVIRARGAIAEILTANAAKIPTDKKTRDALKHFVDFTADYPANPQPVLKAIAKLRSVTAN